SRIRAGRVGLEREPVELGALVRDVARRTVQGVQPDAVLRLDCAAVEGQWDPLRLEQVVTNLVANACKYGGGGPIDVRVQRQGDAVQIVVSDHGIGLSAADQTRVF